MPAPPATDASERAVLDRLRAGDAETFSTLVDAYHDSLRRLARTFVADNGAAEEVVQDTWVGVLKGLPAFEGRSTLKTWIFRILVNRAKTRGVRDRRLIPFSALESRDGDPPEPLESRFTPSGAWALPPQEWDTESPEQLVSRRETLTAIEDAIAALPPGQRAVITLRDIEGVDPAEVCNMLQITETNQRVLLHRARTRVRAALESHIGRTSTR
jgi:RNA polymerase sigma-70 factor (ECF subfamily)